VSASVIERGRTKLSRVFGILYILAFSFSERLLETGAHFVTQAMILAGSLLVGVAVIGRLWCALYIAGYKSGTLIKEGPYSICRHPLYLFSMLGALGVGLCTECLTLALAVLLAFAAAYPSAIRAEERRLREIFGEEYERYARAVPRFLPDFSLYREPLTYTVNTASFRREMRDSLLFVAAIGLFEIIESFGEAGVITPLYSLW
jgi:protein-S-isoprenylcysteine O-methyltransferase Ste14